MREVPADIERRLKDKDPLAKIYWDMEIHQWVLYWDGVRICTLFHSDGSDMMELCWDEISTMLDRFDNHKDGPERITAIRQTAANARRKAALRAEVMQEESMREAERVTRVQQSGCPLQVYVHNNKLGEKKNA